MINCHVNIFMYQCKLYTAPFADEPTGLLRLFVDEFFANYRYAVKKKGDKEKSSVKTC